MRTIAISLIVVAGAGMAAVGTLTESISLIGGGGTGPLSNNTDNWGILVVLFGLGLFTCDLLHWGPCAETPSTDDEN